MKKLMTLAALVAACAPAFTAEVTSSNTVGYQKLQLGENAMDIIAVQFQAIGGGEVNIQNFKPNGDFSTTGGDWIKFWDASTRRYTELYYFDVASDGVFEADDEEYTNSLGAGWGDGEQRIYRGSVKAGRGFWSKAEEGGAVLVSGEVPVSSVVTLGENAMDIIANPLPVRVDIQQIVPGDGFSTTGGDWIKFWNANTRRYTELYYFDVASDGVFEADDEEYTNSLGAGWGDGEQRIYRGFIDVGQGFWAKAEYGGTLTFPNPLSPVAAEGND